MSPAAGVFAAGLGRPEVGARRPAMSTIAQSTPARKRRRGHGEGSIYRRESDGNWVGTVDLGFVDGKRRRKVVYAKTRREVQQQLDQLRHQRSQGVPLNP